MFWVGLRNKITTTAGAPGFSTKSKFVDFLSIEKVESTIPLNRHVKVS